MRSRSLCPRSFVVILQAASAVFVSGCGALGSDTVFSPPGTTTTIFLVRHAERDQGLDPPLNDEGVIRAVALADALEDEGVTAVFYPDLIRNRQTAEPLVERFNPTIREFTQLEVAATKTLANTIVDEVVRDHAGGVVLWIGNTGPVIDGIQEGNLQELYARLGGTGSPPTQYQNLYRIVLTESAPPAITPGNYGGTSSLD